MKAAVVVCLLGGAAIAATHRDEVDTRIRYQVMENFGASDCWSMQKIGVWSEASKQKAAELLFSREKGIGLSCWRFNLGGGISGRITNPWRTAETFEIGEGRYDWTRQANERWFLREAKARGVEQFLAFVNSPPGRMTRNGLTFVSKGDWTTNLKPGFEPQFARYLADIVEHFRSNPDPAERIAFDYVSPINEPQWDWEGTTQEGCRYSNEDIRRVLSALGAELKKRGLKAAIAAIESGILPDMWSEDEKATKKYGAPFGNYLAALAGRAEIAPLLGHRLSYHGYWSERLDGEIVEDRERLGAELRKYPGWKLWMSEYCVLEGPEGKGGRGRDLGIDTALDVARLIHYDLTAAQVSAWQWWLAVSNENFKDGLVYTDYRRPGDAETVCASKLLWALGHWSRFVRPGMVRVELRGEGHDKRGLLGSAFRDRKSGRLVVVYVNEGRSAEQVSLTVRGRRIRGLRHYVTTNDAGDDLRDTGLCDPARLIEIPARSLVTLVSIQE
jgi:O-glycosyl hydrolase